MQDLTGFQRDLLFSVAGLEAPNGVAVKGELEDYYGDEVRHGRLYPNLDTLVENDLLDKGQKDRRTNEYTLTEHGRDVLSERLDWQTDYADTIAEDVPRPDAD